ncbi:DUF551 domain-containing protein [Flavonifractor plautii]|uniref:DUF551 domain-containing protein n=2 Tax=Flavonifractor plautii TaxID=292800 RepID=UPI003B9802CB
MKMDCVTTGRWRTRRSRRIGPISYTAATSTTGRADSMSEWISVKERLPEEKQRVIVRCERIGTSVGWILWGEWMTDIGPSAGKITHWMPLPDPPKEG